MSIYDFHASHVTRHDMFPCFGTLLRAELYELDHRSNSSECAKCVVYVCRCESQIYYHRTRLSRSLEGRDIDLITIAKQPVTASERKPSNLGSSIGS